MLPRSKPQTITQQEELGDLRFRKLLSQDAWNSLPTAVKKRFSKRLSGGETAIYTGIVKEVRISKVGRIFAQALRILGAPLPVFDHVNVPTVVTVTEDVKTGGQIWTRMYANRSGFPQVIHSAKRFSGATGLEEYIGWGINMQLRVKACKGGLEFTSDGYTFLGIRLPRFVSPGALTVRHVETTPGMFHFEMILAHPALGELVHQVAEYRDGGLP
jgi:hypothetical protein